MRDVSWSGAESVIVIGPRATSLARPGPTSRDTVNDGCG
jgi:hypothetical protein